MLWKILKLILKSISFIILLFLLFYSKMDIWTCYAMSPQEEPVLVKLVMKEIPVHKTELIWFEKEDTTSSLDVEVGSLKRNTPCSQTDPIIQMINSHHSLMMKQMCICCVCSVSIVGVLVWFITYFSMK